jgi:hypothetical protein
VRFDRPVPATVIASGEDRGVGKHHEVLAHLWLLGIGWGQPVEAARQRQATGGEGKWQGQCSGGRGRRGSGRGASGQCEEAWCGVNWGRGRLEKGDPPRAGGGGERRSSAVVSRPELEDDWGSVSTSRGRGNLLGG